MYGNEEGVGRAIARQRDPARRALRHHQAQQRLPPPDDARRAFDESLRKLGLDRVDLFLIHWPLPTQVRRRLRVDLAHADRVLAQGGDGRATSIGVSNFEPDHLKRIIDDTGMLPAVNQVEVHPYFGNEAVRAANASHGVATEAWSPIAQGDVLDDPTIVAIAERLDRTPAQVTLRWHIQRGDIVFPKSMKPERMRENFAIFDFELDRRRHGGHHRARPGRAGPAGRRTRTTMDWIPARRHGRLPTAGRPK